MSTEAAPSNDLGDLLQLEKSVLQTLCMTVNSDGSQLKYDILDNLTAEDFYFPVTRTLYRAITELHEQGSQVVSGSLDELLKERSTDLPDDFYLEDLFTGELPSQEGLAAWMERMKSREQVKAKPFDQTHESVKSPLATGAAPQPEPPPPPPPTPQAPAAPPPPAAPAASEDKDSAATMAASLPQEPEPTSVPASPADDLLAPESGQWLGFLADLTRKQGKRFKTGFAGIDGDAGGLMPGLFLVAGEHRKQLLDFVKQLVDQFAIACDAPCMYLSFESNKAALRLMTLSRLSLAPAKDIETGHFGKDSPEWQAIVRAGEQAVEWLQRIYVVDAKPGLSVTRMRELRKALQDSGAGAPCLIAVDNLEKLANETDLLHSVAELKELAEAFGIVVVGLAHTLELVHERSADMAATFSDAEGHIVVEIHEAGSTTPRTLHFDYFPETHRFVEKTVA